MNAYETINDILVHLFNEIWELEEKAIITEEYKDISNNDMHIIEAIGLGKGNNMSAIAKKLNITVGSLTTSMNSLVNKKHPQGITLWMFLWTWRELNPRPKAYSLRHLPSQSLF